MRTSGRYSESAGARGREMLGGREESGRRKLYTCQKALADQAIRESCQRFSPGIVRLPMNLIMGIRSAAAEARRTLVANILKR